MIILIMRWSNCSAPIPLPGTPGDITFCCCCCPGLFITLFPPCPALINNLNPFIFECPALSSLHFRVPLAFLSHEFFLWPRGCLGEMVSERFDLRISTFISKSNWGRYWMSAATSFLIIATTTKKHLSNQEQQPVWNLKKFTCGSVFSKAAKNLFFLSYPIHPALRWMHLYT